MRKRENHGGRKQNPSAGLRGRIWIDGDEGTFLGYGRVVLLERIGEYGSITKAAKSMEMSYRHAWELVESMNRQADAPLVDAVTGGKGGGGARLTGEGKKAVHLFWQCFSDFQDFLSREEKMFFSERKTKAAAKRKIKCTVFPNPRDPMNKEGT